MAGVVFLEPRSTVGIAKLKGSVWSVGRPAGECIVIYSVVFTVLQIRVNCEFGSAVEHGPGIIGFG